MIYALRPYQADAIERIRAELRAGHKRVLLVSPTGSGKTVLAADMIRAATAKGSRTLFIAHRKELIDQTSAKLDAFSVPHGIVMADHPRWRPLDLVQVASRDTLVRRLGKIDLGRFQLIVADEAHHARCESMGKILDAYPEATIIGATATPWRTDGKGLKDIFNALVVAASVRDLTEQGFLVPVDGFAYDVPNLRDVKKVRGEFDLTMLAAAMKEVVLGGRLIHDYLEHARGKRAICFAVNVAHSKAITEQARAAGIPAEHVDDSTPAGVRAAIIGPNGRLARGETLFVSNVGIATEGLDIPAVEVIVLARPTASVALAMQMMGRGLRPSDGKTKCLIHDHAGVLLSHGLPDDDREYTLEDDKPRGTTGLKTCKKCFAVVAKTCARCPRCGNRFEVMPERTGNERRVREDEKIGRLTLDEIRARRPGDVRVLTDEQLRRVRLATRAEKAAEYLRLRAVREAKGFQPGWIAHQYRAVFGVWPKFAPGELDGVEPARSPFVTLERREHVEFSHSRSTDA